MTLSTDLRAQPERCRRVGFRYGGDHHAPMQHLAAQLDAQALAIEEAKLAGAPAQSAP